MSEAGLAVEVHAPAIMEESPFAIPSKKLVMWLFIISDAVTFGAMLFAYGYVKNASPDWPEPFRFSPSILNAMLMTFILVSSSLTMLMATRAAKSGDKAGGIRWTFITVAGGVLFALRAENAVGVGSRHAARVHLGIPLNVVLDRDRIAIRQDALAYTHSRVGSTAVHR